MTAQKAHETPGRTKAVDGEVVLNGPDGIGLSMTPEAAEETARRLHRSAEAAYRQRSKQATARKAGAASRKADD